MKFPHINSDKTTFCKQNLFKLDKSLVGLIIQSFKLFRLEVIFLVFRIPETRSYISHIYFFLGML